MQFKYIRLGPNTYQLTASYMFDASSFGVVGHSFNHYDSALAKNGIVLLKQGFTWDGPSGPAIDTPDLMRASALHDFGYRSIRRLLLPVSMRRPFDMILRAVHGNDSGASDGIDLRGMELPWYSRAFHRARNWWVWAAVRDFGAGSAEPGSEEEYVFGWDDE